MSYLGRNNTILIWHLVDFKKSVLTEPALNVDKADKPKVVRVDFKARSKAAL